MQCHVVLREYAMLSRLRVVCVIVVFFTSVIADYSHVRAQAPAIVAETEHYLSDIGPNVPIGTERYYAVKALDEALGAFKEGNYGIGAVTIVKWRGQIYEFRGRNAMATGYGLRDHAEARALDRAVVFLSILKGKHVRNPEGGVPRCGLAADASYGVCTPFLESLKDGIHVYGTLEPCPMCMVMMINIGVKSSKSLVKDGESIVKDKHIVSDGAALVTSDKIVGAPMVWQKICQHQGLQFVLYDADKRLCDLSRRIFLETRQQIDDRLGAQSSDDH